VDRKALVFLVIILGLLIVPLIVACGGGGQEPPVPPAAEQTPGGGEGTGAPTGDELLQTRCTLCHTLDRVQAAAKTQAEWEATVERMRGKGAELTDAEAQTLIQFLATNYGP
jgi:cytochrome c5